MLRKTISRKMLVTASMFLSIISIALLTSFLPVAKSQVSAVTKPKEFYFHYVDTPVSVAGLQTKYIMNTTQWWKFATQQEAFTNSFYKPVGQPKITVDFYLYPNLAGPVTINGMWQIFLWVNSSAYRPVGFNISFKEITLNGSTLWDSGQLSPTVNSSVDDYIDVPVYNYNLSTTLNHSFNVDTTLHVQVEVNAGSSADTRIWYDSSFYPSKAILPVEDYALPFTIKTYAVDGSETNTFYANVSADQRKVIVRANVTDPFGGYDIYKVNMTIFNPSGTAVVDNVDMTRVTDGLWRIHYSHIYEGNWTYAVTVLQGEYIVKISVIDNNGYYHNIEFGTYAPFIEEDTHNFTIGELVYYNPSFLFVDDTDAPLPRAQVYIRWPNGTLETMPRYTSANGFVNLTHVVAGVYGFTVFWKDTVVLQTTEYVNASQVYTFKCRVYQLTVEVLGNNRAPVQGAYVIVYAEGGAGYGLDISDASGEAVFKLPAGTYTAEAHYSAYYWLTAVAAKGTTPAFAVANTMSQTVILDDFPPAIWNTTGFWLVMALVAAVIVAVLLTVFRKRLGLPFRAKD